MKMALVGPGTQEIEDGGTVSICEISHLEFDKGRYIQSIRNMGGQLDRVVLRYMKTHVFL